jgi:uncharacterized protein (TIGR02246 family)
VSGGQHRLAARVAALEAREGVRELLARYVRMVDGADMDALRELFAPDVTWVSPGRVTLDGLDAVAGYYADWFASPYRGTRHHLVNERIEVAGDGGRATAASYYLELAAYEELSIVGFGNYLDVCEREDDGRWRIAHKEVEVLGLARLDEGWARGLFAPGG